MKLEDLDRELARLRKASVREQEGLALTLLGSLRLFARILDSTMRAGDWAEAERHIGVIASRVQMLKEQIERVRVMRGDRDEAPDR